MSPRGIGVRDLNRRMRAGNPLQARTRVFERAGWYDPARSKTRVRAWISSIGYIENTMINTPFIRAGFVRQTVIAVVVIGAVAAGGVAAWWHWLRPAAEERQEGKSA